MFNYFACRKLAEEELNKSLQDLVALKKQQKIKCKYETTKLTSLMRRNPRHSRQTVQAARCQLREKRKCNCC